MEYARFGDGYLRRDSPDAEWEQIARDDVPQEQIDAWEVLDARKGRVAQHGYDPDEPPTPFARIIPAGDPENTATGG